MRAGTKVHNPHTPDPITLPSGTGIMPLPHRWTRLCKLYPMIYMMGVGGERTMGGRGAISVWVGGWWGQGWITSTTATTLGAGRAVHTVVCWLALSKHTGWALATCLGYSCLSGELGGWVGTWVGRWVGAASWLGLAGAMGNCARMQGLM